MGKKASALETTMRTMLGDKELVTEMTFKNVRSMFKDLPKALDDVPVTVRLSSIGITITMPKKS